MVITLNSFDNNITNYSFKSKKTKQPEQPVQSTVSPDAVNVPVKKEKTGLWGGIKKVITNVQKFFIATGEYIKGGAKGLFVGGLSAASIVGVSAVANKVKDIKTFKGVVNPISLVKSPFKVPTKAKVLAGAVGLAVLGYNLFKANLNSNEKGAKVDHRWNTGHKDK